MPGRSVETFLMYITTVPIQKFFVNKNPRLLISLFKLVEKTARTVIASPPIGHLRKSSVFQEKISKCTHGI